MTERKYSLSEIDQMRRTVARLWSIKNDGCTFRAEERVTEIEEELRTHLMIGTDPIALDRYADELDSAASECAG